MIETVQYPLTVQPAGRVRPFRDTTPLHRLLLSTLALILTAAPAFAQASPWENAVTQLETSFTGPIARGLSLVAIVIGGLMFAYSEGAAKKTFAGILFGCGAALAANNFMTWLFP